MLRADPILSTHTTQRKDACCPYVCKRCITSRALMRCIPAWIESRRSWSHSHQSLATTPHWSFSKPSLTAFATNQYVQGLYKKVRVWTRILIPPAPCLSVSYPTALGGCILAGVLSIFLPIINSIEEKQNNKEIAFLIITIVRSLSETKACRTEMLSKGCVDFLLRLVSYTSDLGKLLTIKSLHNMLKIVQSFPSAIFEMAVDVVIELIRRSSDQACLQYCSDCIIICTQQENCKRPRWEQDALSHMPKPLIVVFSPPSDRKSVV